MAGLQRSAVSFRRQGSSGFVWDDDKFLSEELNKLASHNNNRQTENLHAPPPPPLASINTTVDRSRSNGAGRGYRTGKVSPAIEPPSPKLSACGFCGAFGRTRDKAAGHRTKLTAGKHRSR